MAPLIVPRLACRVHKVGNRGAAQANRRFENFADGAPELRELRAAELRALALRMKPRAPEALVGVDVSHAAEHVLIEQQRLDHRTPRTEPRAEFFFAHFQRVSAQQPEVLRECGFSDDGEAAKAANVRVTQLAAVIQHECGVRMKPRGLVRALGDKLPRHSQVNEQGLTRLTRRRAVSGCKPQQKKLAEALHGYDLVPRKVALERRRIVHEIGFSQTHGEDAAAHQHRTQAARDRFDFRQLRHGDSSGT